MSRLIEEEYYEEMMEHTVRPGLEKCKIELYLEREPGREIYCAGYLAQAAKGTVLISHGFTENAEKYMETAWYLLNAGYHVYILEHCGHGRSYRLTDDNSLVHVDSYHRYIEDLVFVAQKVKKRHPNQSLYLFGHSMGGGIAAAALAEAPELFQGAILTSPMLRPLTGNVPWTLTKIITAICCRAGKAENYVVGHHPYEGKEAFEASASTSRARFEYAQKFRTEEELFRQSGASYGWLRAACGLNRMLRRGAWKRIKTSLLIFQAEKDTFVSGREQEWFVRRIARQNLGNCRLIRVPGTKHEIYNAENECLERYWGKVLRFLEECGRKND